MDRNVRSTQITYCRVSPGVAVLDDEAEAVLAVVVALVDEAGAPLEASEAAAGAAGATVGGAWADDAGLPDLFRLRARLERLDLGPPSTFAAVEERLAFH